MVGHKTIKEMKFKIATTEGVREVEGEPIEILGHKCFYSFETDASKWGEFFAVFIHEFSTGMKVCHDFSLEEAKEKAIELFQSHNEIEWKKVAQGHLRYAGISFPVNN